MIPEDAIKIMTKNYWLDGFFVCVQSNRRFIVKNFDRFNNIGPELLQTYTKCKNRSEETLAFFNDTREVYLLDPHSKLFEFGIKLYQLSVLKEGEDWKVVKEGNPHAVKAEGIKMRCLFEVQGLKIKKYIVRLKHSDGDSVKPDLSPTGLTHQLSSDLLDQYFGDVNEIFPGTQFDLWIELAGNYENLVNECRCIFVELRKFRANNNGLAYSLVVDFINVQAKSRPSCKNVHVNTAITYGQLVLPFYLMLVHFKKFEFYNDYKKFVDELWAGIDIDILEKDIGVGFQSQITTRFRDRVLSAEYLALVKQKCLVIHQMIKTLIDSTCPEVFMFFQTLLKHSCIMLSAERVRKEVYQRVTLVQSRQLLDSIKLFFKYAMIYEDPINGVKQVNLLYESSGSRPWEHMKHMYSAIIKQAVEMSKYTINMSMTGDYEIFGKHFSIAGFKHLYETSIGNYKEASGLLLRSINSTQTVEQTYNKIMSILERTTHGGWQLADMFSSGAIGDEFEFHVRQDLDFKRILELINRLTMNLVLALYLVTGMKLRFTELRNIALTDHFAAVWIDRTTKLIYLVNAHNKTPDLKKNVLFTNEKVSQLLYHYILIIRPLQIHVLKAHHPELLRVRESEFDMVNTVELHAQAAEGDDFEDDPDLDLDADEISYYGRDEFITADELPSKVHRMYLFTMVEDRITLPTHKNMAREIKNNKIKNDSAGSVRLFRQLGVQISRDAEKLANSREVTRTVAAVEGQAGHSVQTAATEYGIITDLPVGLTSLDMALMKSIGEKFWIFMGFTGEPIVRIPDKTIAHTPCLDLKDVESSGKKIYGDGFQFKSLEQLRAVVTLMTSRQPHVAIQAPTGFGKTEVFLLNILALEKRRPTEFLNIVLVPYLPLKFNMLNRFTKQNIRVGNLENLVEHQQKGKLEVIYVGIWDDAISTEIKRTIEKLDRTKRLGYLVLDEYHTIAKDRTYRHQATDAVSDMVSGKKWLKVAMLSATLQSSESHEYLTINPDNVRTENFVVELPHKNRIFLKTDTMSSHTSSEVTERLKAFMSISEGKCIVLFSNKAVMDAAYDHFKVKCPDVPKRVLCGDDKTEDKAQAMLEFSELKGRYVVFGTKLLTHGIDSNDVKLVIMVDFYQDENDTEDVIQSIGRIRGKGIAHFLFSETSNDHQNASEEKCFSSVLSRYYFPNVEQPEHHTCCSLYHIRDHELRELADLYLRHPLQIETADGFVELPTFEIANENLKKLLLESKSQHCLLSKENLNAVRCLIQQATDDSQNCPICLHNKCTRRKRCHCFNSKDVAAKCMIILVVAGVINQDEIKSLIKSNAIPPTEDLIEMAGEQLEMFMQYHMSLTGLQDADPTLPVQPLDLQNGTELFNGDCDIAQLVFYYDQRQIEVKSSGSERRVSYWEHYSANYRHLDMQREDCTFIFSYEMMNHLSFAFLNCGQQGVSGDGKKLFYGGGPGQENIRFTLGLALHFMFFNETLKAKVQNYCGSLEIKDSFTWMCLMNQKFSRNDDYYFYHLAFALFNEICTPHLGNANDNTSLNEIESRPSLLKEGEQILKWVSDLVESGDCIASYCIKGLRIRCSVKRSHQHWKRTLQELKCPGHNDDLKSVDLGSWIHSDACYFCLLEDHSYNECKYPHRQWLRYIYLCCFFNDHLRRKLGEMSGSYKVENFQTWENNLRSSKRDYMIAVFSCLMDYVDNIDTSQVDSGCMRTCSDTEGCDTTMELGYTAKRSLVVDHRENKRPRVSNQEMKDDPDGTSIFSSTEYNDTANIHRDHTNDITGANDYEIESRLSLLKEGEQILKWVSDLVESGDCIASYCIKGLRIRCSVKRSNQHWNRTLTQLNCPCHSLLGSVDLMENLNTGGCFYCLVEDHYYRDCRYPYRQWLRYVYFCCFFNDHLRCKLGQMNGSYKIDDYQKWKDNLKSGKTEYFLAVFSCLMNYNIDTIQVDSDCTRMCCVAESDDNESTMGLAYSDKIYSTPEMIEAMDSFINDSD